MYFYRVNRHFSDQGVPVQAAVLDFSKAFDKVPHSKLIYKIKSLHVSGYIVNWIQDFLKNRDQKVVLGTAVSRPLEVLSGVPQGSVLGPVLFLVYINDIVNCVEHANIKLFAEDTILYLPITSNNDVAHFQQDLDSLTRWASTWDMSFNVNKSQVILFTRSRQTISQDYYLCGALLTPTDNIKYLGININKDLTWSNHIHHLTAKANRILGLLRYTLYDAPLGVRLVAYTTLCRPLLEYASPAWDPHIKSLVYDLESVQNRAVRFICRLRGREVSVTSARNQLGLNTLANRRKEARLSMLLHILAYEDLFPSLIKFYNAMLPTNSHPNTRSRTANTALATYSHTNAFQHSFLIRTTRELRLSGGPITDD